MARVSRRSVSEGYVRVWKLMHADAWEKLQSQPVHIGYDLENLVGTIYGAIYGFLIRQVSIRAGGDGKHIPWSYDLGKPDMREMRSHYGYGPMVRLELFVPVEQVMLHLHFPWYDVMHSYHRSILPETEKNEPALQAWQNELVANGIEPIPSTFGYPFPEPFQSRLEAGWERIFDIDLATTDPREISVSFERLDLGNVVSVQEFAGIGTRMKN